MMQQQPTISPTLSSPTFVPQSMDQSFHGTSLPPGKPSKLTNLSSSTSNALPIERRRLILFNLPEDLVKEYLELYLEHISGETEIERIDYSNLEDTTVMVTFKTEIDFAEVRRRHATRSKLNNSEISLAEVNPPATVMIQNLPTDISRDVLELYFSNRRRSDGGQVVEVTFNPEHQYALVTFTEHQDARRVVQREHSIHGHRLDVRIFYQHMGIEPFIDASNVGKKPDPIRYRIADDSRYLFLIRNHKVWQNFLDQLKCHKATIHLENEDWFEISYNSARCTVKQRQQWTHDIARLVDDYLSEYIIVHRVPWNNRKIPSITPEQLNELCIHDQTRLMQLTPTDHILVIALKDHFDRALSELTDMLTALTMNSTNTIPLNDAVYRSKPVTTARDPKVDNQRSSVFLRSSPSRQSSRNKTTQNSIVDDYVDNLRMYQIDLLSMRFINLAREIYLNIKIDVQRMKRRIHLHGLADQVIVCKNYFLSILQGLVHKYYKIGKEMAVFLSNPDTVEIIIQNLARLDFVCAYEIERVSSTHNRRASVSPTSLSSTSSHNQHKLILYSLTREQCDRVYEHLLHEVHISTIMLDKDDRRCLASDSWHDYARGLYSDSGNGAFRRRRVLLQVKQNQLTLVGFEHDVHAMRKRIEDYFVENAISFYESD